MDLSGNWKRVSAVGTAADGIVTKPWGDDPVGFLTYTNDGRMWGLISSSGRKRLSGDWASAPADERAEAFTSSFAYTGRYTVHGDDVVHFVEAATIENMVNTEVVRFFAFEGGRLILRTPPISYGSVQQTFEIVWKRLPPEGPVE
jgi:hypothetical protein